MVHELQVRNNKMVVGFRPCVMQVSHHLSVLGSGTRTLQYLASKTGIQVMLPMVWITIEI